jgi:hypothetical protein
MEEPAQKHRKLEEDIILINAIEEERPMLQVLCLLTRRVVLTFDRSTFNCLSRCRCLSATKLRRSRKSRTFFLFVWLAWSIESIELFVA